MKCIWVLKIVGGDNVFFIYFLFDGFCLYLFFNDFFLLFFGCLLLSCCGLFKLSVIMPYFIDCVGIGSFFFELGLFYAFDYFSFICFNIINLVWNIFTLILSIIMPYFINCVEIGSFFFDFELFYAFDYFCYFNLI